MMVKTQIIDSVEVIHQHPDGPDFIKRGNRCGTDQRVIADITEEDGTYYFL